MSSTRNDRCVRPTWLRRTDGLPSTAGAVGEELDAGPEQDHLTAHDDGAGHPSEVETGQHRVVES